jgi:hypothetical protein
MRFTSSPLVAVTNAWYLAQRRELYMLANGLRWYQLIGILILLVTRPAFSQIIPVKCSMFQRSNKICAYVKANWYCVNSTRSINTLSSLLNIQNKLVYNLYIQVETFGKRLFGQQDYIWNRDKRIVYDRLHGSGFILGINWVKNLTSKSVFVTGFSWFSSKN